MTKAHAQEKDPQAKSSLNETAWVVTELLPRHRHELDFKHLGILNFDNEVTFWA